MLQKYRNLTREIKEQSQEDQKKSVLLEKETGAHKENLAEPSSDTFDGRDLLSQKIDSLHEENSNLKKQLDESEQTKELAEPISEKEPLLEEKPSFDEDGLEAPKDKGQEDEFKESNKRIKAKAREQKAISSEEPVDEKASSKGTDRDDEGFQKTGGDQIYTLIEKIENSHVDIHSQRFGGEKLGMRDFHYDEQKGQFSESEPSYGKSTQAGEFSPSRTSNQNLHPPPHAATNEERHLSPDEYPHDFKTQLDQNVQTDGKGDAKEIEKKNGETKNLKRFNPYAIGKEGDLFEKIPPSPFQSLSDNVNDDKTSVVESAVKKEELSKVEAPSHKSNENLPEVDKNKLDITLRDDEDEKYGKHLKLTYLFDSMPENARFSKFKKPLRNACRITLLGNLEEGLGLFDTLKQQPLPPEYKEMIDKNIRDVKYYLRGKYRSSKADLD